MKTGKPNLKKQTGLRAGDYCTVVDSDIVCSPIPPNNNHLTM